MKVYPIFYISLLKSANSETLIVNQRLSKLSRYKKYKIKNIKEYDPKTQRYIIKWKRYLTEKDL